MATNAKTTPTTRVHNLIILDESGSMMSIYKPAITGVNETLQAIRMGQHDNPGQQHYVTLVAFDSSHYNLIYKNTPIAHAADITTEQYRPGGCTPLYDAMGRAISELRPAVLPGDVALVTIITDGYENASREFNAATIKGLVKQLEAEDWVFTYIGANQDVTAVANSLAIKHHMAFQADESGTNEMFAKERAARSRFFGKISFDRSSLNEDYFDK